MPKQEILRTLSPKRRRTNDDESQPTSVMAITAPRGSKMFGKTSKRKVTEGLPDPEDEETFEKEWGLSKRKEAELLAEFRRQLQEMGALKPQHDIYMHRRFLRARQHDLKKAKEMFLAHLKWRKENEVDTILDTFDFHEKDAFISVYPQGYHKTDKLGRPIYIQHLGQINLKQILDVTTEERMIKFHIQEYERCNRYIFPVCSKVAGRHIDQTLAILDVKGVGLKHLTGDVKRMLGKITSIDQANYPESLGHTCIINAPNMFKLLWTAVRPMLDPRTQEKIEVCPKDYLPALLKWVEPDSLPEYLGGISKATLLDDAGPWNDQRLIAEVDAAWRARFSSGAEAPEEEHGLASRSASATSAAALTPPGLPQFGPPAAGASPGAFERPSHSRSVSGVSLAFGGQPGPFGAQAGPGPGSEVGSDADYADAESTIMRRYSTSSAMSGDDDAFYSPRSVDSGMFAFDRTSGRYDRVSTVSVSSMPADAAALQESLRAREDEARAASGSKAGVAGPSPGRGAGGELLAAVRDGRHSPLEPSGSALQIPILARVKALEAQIPVLESSLRKQFAPGVRASAGLGEGTLLSRVEVLEGAVDVLLRAQEAALQQARQEQAAKESKASCGCCCIM